MPFDNAVKDNKDIKIPSKYNRFIILYLFPEVIVFPLTQKTASNVRNK